MEILLSFLNLLEHAKIDYRLEHVRDSIVVVIAIPGQRCEIEFFANGEIEIERFVSTGVVLADEATLAQLIVEQI